MTLKVSVYIATSLDGFIAKEDGAVDWLEHDAGDDDYGYHAFMASVDVLVMGRNSFEKVLTFGDWPYTVPVVVMSRTLAAADVPQALVGKVQISSQEPEALVQRLADEGSKHLYLDGGKLIQSFLSLGLVDELILTRLPILLGAGIPLFGELGAEARLEHVATEAFRSGLVQSTYRVLR